MRGGLGRFASLLLATALVSGCAPGAAATVSPPPSEPGADSSAGPGDSSTGDGPSSPVRGEQPVLDEASFWQLVDDVRTRAHGDPEVTGELLTARLTSLDDTALTAYQNRYLDLSARLYTWRHWQAAEMACGFTSDDVFTDWRAFVIAHGRSVYESAVTDADTLADVADLPAGCAGVGEAFGFAALTVHDDRHGGDPAALDAFPYDDLEEPDGPRLRDHTAVRADLPRLAVRIPRDGLGQAPGVYVDHRSGVLGRLVSTVTGAFLDRLAGRG
ncbi:DUF4240 domain-containing protein [Kineococcus aurantiacus]|uniref:DUF4240 domain-containing protein n=1 Tax=Kineococcus aurantiacus TaxID=37633 RepID=A0A7Y9J3D9_9ACTN|nr:hypothetical protein [Kineococcus aurantiacus]